jgi:hypothetical protein
MNELKNKRLSSLNSLIGDKYSIQTIEKRRDYLIKGETPK